MTKIFSYFMVLSTLVSVQSHSQTDKKDKRVYRYVHKMPQFKSDVNLYIERNLLYPSAAKHNKIQGRVNVQFLITKDGKIEDIKIVTPFHPLLDSEATRIIREMPDWIPGEVSEKPVDVYYTLPIHFSL